MLFKTVLVQTDSGISGDSLLRCYHDLDLNMQKITVAFI